MEILFPLFEFCKKGIDMTNLEKKIKDCLEPIIKKTDVELYDVIYEKEGKNNYLRIFIDSKDGIDINKCEEVNNAITNVLDEKDFIKNEYFLEVSSAGIEKRLREEVHFNDNIGNNIEVHTFKPIDKQRVLIGTLLENNANYIIIENGEKVIIEKSNISNAKTIYDWDKELKGKEK